MTLDMSYQLPSVTSATRLNMVSSRLVVSLESGFMLCRPQDSWTGWWYDSPEKQWNLDVLHKLLDEVLPWHGTLIVDMAALRAAEIVNFTNTEELARCKGRIAKVAIHADYNQSGKRIAEIGFGNVGAVVHVLSKDFMESVGAGDIRLGWQTALKELAGCDIELPDSLSVPFALQWGRPSDFDEIVLVDITAPDGQVTLTSTGYTSPK